LDSRRELARGKTHEFAAEMKIGSGRRAACEVRIIAADTAASTVGRQQKETKEMKRVWVNLNCKSWFGVKAGTSERKNSRVPHLL
jgi:hypothetical protein